MSEEPRPLQRELERARDEAAGALATAFADDELTLDEYEARLDRCYRAATVADVRDLVAGLPRAAETGSEVTPATGAGARHPAPAERSGHDLVVAVWSGVKRTGRWTPSRNVHAVAVMGGAELDFRDALFPEGVTTVNVLAVMGGVEIVVPPGLRVESAGVPLMGGFERLDQDGDPQVAPGAVLRIRGLACMGGVDVRVATPGDDDAEDDR